MKNTNPQPQKEAAHGVSVVNLDDGKVSVMRGPMTARMMDASTLMAAPDLLDAAERAYQHLQKFGDAQNIGVCVMLRQAIRRATEGK